MLSFDKKIHTLSGLHTEHSQQIQLTSKESILRLLAVRGSLAVEAALVVPLFLFFSLTLISFLQLLAFSVHLQQILFEEGLYISEKIYDGDVMDVSKAVNRMLSKMDASFNIPVEGGLSGLDFGGCDLSDDEFAGLRVDYTAKLLFDPFRLYHGEFCQHVLFHRWIGYENGLHGDGPRTADTVFVYITERSEVYHRNRNCTHIRLNITETTASALRTQRNQYGERYQACRHCHPRKTDATLYITPEGDCYHNSLECSGLSRSVRAIPISEVGTRRPCSRCGY